MNVERSFLIRSYSQYITEGSVAGCVHRQNALRDTCDQRRRSNASVICKFGTEKLATKAVHRCRHSPITELKDTEHYHLIDFDLPPADTLPLFKYCHSTKFWTGQAQIVAGFQGRPFLARQCLKTEGLRVIDIRFGLV